MYMTSGGDVERIKKAKRVMTNAIIGLVIILSSFAITEFILNKLTSATTGGYCPSGDCDDVCPSGNCGYCPSGNCDNPINLLLTM